MITSKDNDLVKRIKSLSQGKFRNKYKEYIVEGIKMTLEALNYAEISNIVICEKMVSDEDKAVIRDSATKKEQENSIIYVSEAVFNYLSDTVSPQGVLCIVKIPSQKIDFSKYKTIFVLDNIQDPRKSWHNNSYS